MISVKKISVVIGLSALTGTAGAVSTVLADQGDPAPAPMVAGDTSSTPRATRAQTSGQFAIQRRPERSGDVVAAKQTGPMGANMDLARAVSTDAGVVRVIPANGAVCLRAEDEVGSAWSCVENPAAVAGELILTLKRPGSDQVRTFGILADGTSSSAVTTATGMQKLTTTEGVYGAVLNAPSSVTFNDRQSRPQAVAVP